MAAVPPRGTVRLASHAEGIRGESRVEQRDHRRAAAVPCPDRQHVDSASSAARSDLLAVALRGRASLHKCSLIGPGTLERRRHTITGPRPQSPLDVAQAPAGEPTAIRQGDQAPGTLAVANTGCGKPSILAESVISGTASSRRPLQPILKGEQAIQALPPPRCVMHRIPAPHSVATHAHNAAAHEPQFPRTRPPKVGRS